MNAILDRYNVTSFIQYRPDGTTQKVLDLYRIGISNTNQIQNLYDELVSMGTIEEIIMDCVYETTDCTPVQFNDPLVQSGAGGEYYLNGMNIPCAWEITHGNSDIIVAVIDQFMDTSHDDMVNKYFSFNSCNPIYDECSHGFAVSGAVSAIINNNICTVGSGYNTKVAAYCVGSDPNDCKYVSPGSGAWKAYKDGHKIINVSASGTGLSKSEVEEMLENGVVLIVSAYGNNHTSIRGLEGVIHVGVADQNRNHVDYGGFTPGVDLYALCKAVPRLQAMNGCAYAGPNTDTGMSSFGAPTVAGIIALMKSENPCLNPAELEKLLKDNHGGLPNNAVSLGITAGIMDAYEAVQAAKDGVDLVIDSDVEFDKDKSISGNLFLKNGGQLTVKSIVSFGPNSRIIVERGGKLILDGGTLTSCSDTWQGIIVEGFGSSLSQDQAGLVELKNEAIIENAKIAISCSPSHILWPNFDFYGGLIKAENSTISNCNKGVEFMKYGVNNIEDDSYFTNVTFTGCKNGVTLWSNNGVEFTNCTFSSILENGILPLDSRAVISGCTFNDVKTGVNVHSTMPIPFSTEIHNNDFYTTNEGIKANTTANSTSLDIFNNNFFGSYFGLLMSGASHYHVQKNDFLNQNTSTVFYDTNLGIDDQMVDNNVSNSEVGSLANKSNYTVYVDNCFGYNGNADLNVSGASIFPFQRDTEIDDEAAGNCFSKNGTNDIYTTFSSVPFTYYLKQRETIPCKVPTNPGPNTPNGNYGLDYVGQDDPDDCGSSTGPGIIFVKYRNCPVPKTKAELLQAIADIKSLIALYEQTAGENSYHYYLIKKYKACLKRLQVSVPAVFKLEAFPNWRQEAITYVNNESDFQVRAFAYALMVDNNEFSNARIWLNALSKNTEETQDFYSIQNINLDYLEDRDHYQISTATKTLLYDLGRKDIPYNGFARSLHFVLTGEEVPIDLDYGGQPTTPRSKKSNKNWVIEHYPNPVNGQEYTINISSSNLEEVYEVNIMDIHGKNIYSSTNIGSKELKIDNHTWSSGIYFVKICTQNELLSINKLIKI